jgi:hypothetical protein
MAEHKLTPEVILGTAVPIADLLTQLTMPYGNISEKLRDMGEKRGLTDQTMLADVFGGQIPAMVMRISTDYKEGVYDTGAPELLFPVRDGVTSHADPIWSAHVNWLENELPVQQKCSEVGQRVFRLLASTPNAVLLKNPGRYNDDNLNAAVALDEETGTPTGIQNLNARQQWNLYHDIDPASSLKVSYYATAAPLDDCAVRLTYEGERYGLDYSRSSIPDGPRNGWTTGHHLGRRIPVIQQYVEEAEQALTELENALQAT